MTTYTITEAQRKRLIDAMNAGYMGRKYAEYVEANEMLQSLEPALAQQGEPLGTVVEYRNNNFGFYRWGESPYLDNALAHWIVYAAAPAPQAQQDLSDAERKEARAEMTLEQFLAALRAQFRTRGS